MAFASEAEALADVLRLARGMTFKAAMADLPYGGGKTVIIGDPRTGKSEALFRALGWAVDSLGGRYYTGEDVGTTPADMDIAGEETPYVLGRSRGGSGDPAPVTARGVRLGIRAAVRYRLGRDSLKGVRVAIQGLGSVGFNLARLLARDGAVLLVADLDEARAAAAARELGATAVGCADILAVEAEVLAPCALGGMIDDASLPRLACAIVAGAANNQLALPRHGVELHRRGILFAPDYVINAGGLINIAHELRPGGYDRHRAMARLETIPQTLLEVFERSAREGVPAHEVAERIALERIRSGSLQRRAEPRVPRFLRRAAALAG